MESHSITSDKVFFSTFKKEFKPKISCTKSNIFVSGFYYEQAKMNKVKIICVKNHIEEKDSRLDAAFKTFERAQLRANFVKEEYENYLTTSVSFNTIFSRKGRKIDASNDIIEEITTCLYIEQGRAFELLSTEELVVHAVEGMLKSVKNRINT